MVAAVSLLDVVEGVLSSCLLCAETAAHHHRLVWRRLNGGGSVCLNLTPWILTEKLVTGLTAFLPKLHTLVLQVGHYTWCA